MDDMTLQVMAHVQMLTAQLEQATNRLEQTESALQWLLEQHLNLSQDVKDIFESQADADEARARPGSSVLTDQRRPFGKTPRRLQLAAC